MRALASLFCGYIFGLGLLVSGMIKPSKVLGFLDILAVASGNWDPSLAVVMAAALAVTGAGYAFIRPRAPLLAARFQWPAQTAIDAPLIGGAVLFGIGWGLIGLCPGPAIENLATASPPLVVFVLAMAVGMVAHNVWQARARAIDLAAGRGADG